MKDQIDRRAQKRSEAAMAKARTRDSMQALDKLTHIVDGNRRIISDPPLVQPVDELFSGIEREEIMGWLRALVRRYRGTLQSDRRHLLEDFRLVHAALKVVGVGSVGTRAWILLMFGRDENDPLFLQAKEAQPSVLEEFVGPSRHSSNGERVVHGQHLMAAAADIFLGWLTVEGVDGVSRDYYVRQLRDWKGSAVIESMVPATMAYYGRLCGTDPGPRARTLRRPSRDRLLSRRKGRLRSGARRLRRGVRGPERTRLRRSCSSREGRPHHRATRTLT